MAKKINIDTLQEARKISCRLRSTFFYRKINEYGALEFSPTIKSLFPHTKQYSWDNFSKWNITDSAFKLIHDSDLNLIQVFSHPKLLREHPHLVFYYRNIAILSQKATRYLSKIDVKKFESENSKELSEKSAETLTQLFNEHISLIIDNSFGNFKEQEIDALLFSSLGSQIDGAWRNAVGDEAEKIVQIMLTHEAIRRKILLAFIMRKGGDIEKPTKKNIERVVKNIREIKGLMLKNQKSILFSSEPDITLINNKGKSDLVIEVKGGTDPAGALERYGAAKKSFEESLKENKKVKTYLLASCITKEVERRIKNDKTISKYSNLTDLLDSENKKENFLKYVFILVEK